MKVARGNDTDLQGSVILIPGIVTLVALRPYEESVLQQYHISSPYKKHQGVLTKSPCQILNNMLSTAATSMFKSSNRSV